MVNQGSSDAHMGRLVIEYYVFTFTTISDFCIIILKRNCAIMKQLQGWHGNADCRKIAFTTCTTMLNRA